MTTENHVFNEQTIRNRYGEDLLTFAEASEGEFVHRADEYMDAVIDFNENGRAIQGARMPWSKTHDRFRLRAGELSVWAGVNGHGKSAFVGQVMAWLLHYETVLIASLEMRPVETLARMINQTCGCVASSQYVTQWLEQTRGSLMIYDQLDTVPCDRILGLVHFAAKRLKSQHVVIDSLTKCGIPRDDYTKQTEFVDRLQWAAKQHGIHVHLVCHMRKGESEHHKQGKFDIRGAAEITDLADNVLIVKRNKSKEAVKREMANGGVITSKKQALLDQPDTFLSIEKNRHGGNEETFGFWFHEESGQFTPNDKNKPIPWRSLKEVPHGTSVVA